jgi:membrane protein implicated in regulation of membrane protease activity
MNEFFNGMSTLEQTYWVIALVSSAIFFVILVLTFMGGGDADMEADATEFEADDGGVGFQFFTFKGLIGFFVIFGWTGITCLDADLSTTITLIVSTIAGFIMMVVISLLFYWLHKMAASGTLKIENAIGNIGEVYLPIGEKRTAMGKIQIKVQGSLRELEAISDDQQGLATGTMVKVIEIVSAEIVLVERISK